MGLKGNTAIVTGGSKGYGAGIAEALAGAGVEVWITGRDEDALSSTAQRLGVHQVRADVTNGADWDRVFASVMDQRGRVDIFVNNAGAGGLVAPTDEQTDDSIAQSIAVNLTGVVLGCRRAAAIMKRQRSGIIVNISSVCAIYAWPGFGVYSAAKAGMNQFSHCLYTELREFGVRVTTITPSWGATDFLNACNIAGWHPAAQPDIREKCMQPLEMGNLVVQVCQQPAHLEIPDITVQPLVQEIVPM